METFSGEATLLFLFASCLIRDQLSKKRICSPRSEFFPLGVDHILKGLKYPGKQTEATKVVPLCKICGKKNMEVNSYTCRDCCAWEVASCGDCPCDLTSCRESRQEPESH